jgi:aspartate 4-decarboxylase
MDAVTLRHYETLSPFEIKNDLAKVATKTAKASQLAYLNAGRGNPNWIATTPRSAFFLFGQFAITESRRTMDLPAAGLGGMPKPHGVAARLDALSTRQNRGRRKAALLTSFRDGKSSVNADAFIRRAGGLDHRRQYPRPIVLVHNGRSNACLRRGYGKSRACPGPSTCGQGGTVAMPSLRRSGQPPADPGDTIAIAADLRPISRCLT